MAVPNIFGTATAAIPLSQLDQNFATAITLGNTAVYLGNTTTSLGNVTLTNVTISSGNVTVSAGSNTAPSITTVGDTDTGIFFPAADTIAFSEGGVEVARFDSSGNFGIGGAPTQKLDVYGGAGAAVSLVRAASGQNAFFSVAGNGNTFLSTSFDIVQDSTNLAQIAQRANAAMAFSTNNTERMRIDSSGNLGIGTSSPSSVLNVKSSAPVFRLETTGDVTSSGTASYAIKDSSGNDVFANGFLGLANCYQFATTFANGFIRFLTGSQVEAMRIDSSGNVLVGTTNSSITAGTGMKFDLNGTNPQIAIVGTETTSAQLTYSLYSSGASAYRFYVNYAGTIFATSTTISGISDQRLKENIRDLDDGLDKILALKPRKFDWKEGKGANIKDAIGFIAQEFETVFPDMIEEWKDPAPEGEEPYKAVNANLIPSLVKAIQEQQALITALTARITALENK